MLSGAKRRIVRNVALDIGIIFTESLSAILLKNPNANEVDKVTASIKTSEINLNSPAKDGVVAKKVSMIGNDRYVLWIISNKKKFFEKKTNLLINLNMALLEGIFKDEKNFDARIIPGNKKDAENIAGR